MMQIYDPHAWLRHLVSLRRKQAIQTRKTLNARIEFCGDLATGFIDTTCPEEKRKLKELRARLRSLVQGIPLTEALDDDLGAETATVLSDAEQVLLRTAYRAAALLCHPDRGGNAEDFVALNAAYKARDLRAVQEFVIHLEKPLEEQFAYWRDECERPEIGWIQFQQSAMYQIARELQAGGDTATLAISVKRWMQQRIMIAEAELFNTMAAQAAQI